MVEHHERAVCRPGRPVGLLRGEGGRCAPGTVLALRHTGTGPAGAGRRCGAYTELMTASQPLVAEQMLDAYPLQRPPLPARCRRRRGCIRAGGGGTRAGHSLMLFDLPAVAARARSRLAGLGLARVQCTAATSSVEPLPTGADVVSARAGRARPRRRGRGGAAACRARGAAPGGTLLLAEPMAGPRVPRHGRCLFRLLPAGHGQRSPTQRSAWPICCTVRASGRCGGYDPRHAPAGGRDRGQCQAGLDRW
jgi:demethylspheroidene O-methyltransferase